MVLSSKKANSVARDVSWHPNYPVIASTSFEGEINTWTIQNNAEPEKPEIKESEDDREILRRMFGQHIDTDGFDDDDIDHLRNLLFA